MAEQTILEKTRAKVFMRLMPLLVIGYFVTYIDRINLAIVGSSMMQEIHLSPAAFGLASGFFYVGYLFFEVPSNVMLEKLGAKIWLARIMITWGIITGLMIMVWNDWSLIGARFLLGVAEAGFYPGVLLYLGYWFSKHTRGQAWALFQMGLPLASMFGAIFVSLLLNLDGFMGISGWRWAFIVQGGMTVIMGGILLVYLSDRPEKAKWLSDEEKRVLTEDVISADEEKAKHGHNWEGFTTVIKNPVAWYCCLLLFCIFSGFLGFSYWLPQVISKRFQYGPVGSGMLSAIPWVVAAIALWSSIKYADKITRQTPFIAAILLVCFAGISIAAFADNAVVAFIGLCMVGCVQAVVPMQFNYCRSYFPTSLAAITLGLVNSVGNFGGFVGPVILGFLVEMTGSQQTGLFALGCFFLAAVILAAFAPTFIKSQRKRNLLPEKYLDVKMESIS